MALPRQVQLPLAGGCAVLLGGLIGLVWWWRRRDRRPWRMRRLRIGLVFFGLAVLVLGTAWRTRVAIEAIHACRIPPAASAITSARHLDVALAAEKAATWPVSGVLMFYAREVNARTCLYAPADYYVAVHAAHIHGPRVMNVGDVVLSPPASVSPEMVTAVAGHEARHRTQWAVVSVIGGPFLFPVVYALDDLFFPGARNHFERLAGLEAGEYTRTGTGPVFGPLQIFVVVAVGVLVALAVYLRHRRRTPSRGVRSRWLARVFPHGSRPRDVTPGVSRSPPR